MKTHHRKYSFALRSQKQGFQIDLFWAKFKQFGLVSSWLVQNFQLAFWLLFGLFKLK